MPIDISTMTPEQAVQLFNHARQTEGVANEAMALVEFAKAVTGDGYRNMLLREREAAVARVAEIDAKLATA